MIETKKWYSSRTLWANLIALGGVVLSGNFGIQLTAEETTASLVVLNMLLRIITKQPLS